MKLTKTDMLETAASIYEELSKGSSDAEVMDLLAMDVEKYEHAKRFMLDTRAQAELGKPREHVFVEYTIGQQQNIRDLNRLIEHLDCQKQYNAVIGAIRLRSDISDRIINMGQQLGIIRKTPDRKEIVAGIVIADMTMDQLRSAISDQSKLLTDVVGKFGEGDLLDVDPGPTHYGSPTIPALTTVGSDVAEREVDPPHVKKGVGSAKAKSSKRSAGRKRIIE